MTLDRRPSRTGLALTAGASLLAVAGALLAGLGVTLLGGLLAVAGVYRGSRRLLGVGVLALFVGVAAAASGDASTALVLVGMVGTLLTWDIGEHTISLAEQLRERAHTERVSVVHAATSGFAAAVFAIGAYLLFQLSTDGQPAAALLLLVAGSVVALYSLA